MLAVAFYYKFPTFDSEREGGFSAKRDMSSRSGRLYSGRQGGGPLGPKSSLADDTDDSPSPGGCAYT